MTDAPLAVASAVILPEVEEVEPEPTLKRRQSSISEHDNSKRRRVSRDEDASNKQEPTRSAPPARPEGGRNGRLNRGEAAEERKRGRRLFGALLGTLSQSSSSSTAQKRRSDIEKRQQAKLKQQTEEADERKKEKLEILTKVRKKEQRFYDKQSLKIRHSNLLAQAHFLRTKAEPRIFYKPWKLKDEDEDTIQNQIREAEETVEKEAVQWEIDNPPIKEDIVEERNDVEEKDAKPPEENEKKGDTVGENTNTQQVPSSGAENISATNGDADGDSHNVSTNQTKPSEAAESTDHHGAEGEEMVEGEEDTVIY